MEATALDMDGLCLSADTKYVKIEAFRDNIGHEAKTAGSIFCNTLNGNQIGFPESESQLSDLVEYKTKLMDQTDLDVMAMTVNGKSYPTNLPWPKIDFNARNADIYEIESERKINSYAMQIFSNLRHRKSWNSYQSNVELCYTMTSEKDQGKSKEKSSFHMQTCNQFGNWWAVCKFEKKIAVRLSGLCEASPVDMIFSLAEPAKKSSDRHGTFIGMTGWRLEFDRDDKTWKIHHKVFTQNTIKMIEPSRRPFGKKLWSAGAYVCAQGETVPLVLQLSNVQTSSLELMGLAYLSVGGVTRHLTAEMMAMKSSARLWLWMRRGISRMILLHRLFLERNLMSI